MNILKEPGVPWLYVRWISSAAEWSKDIRFILPESINVFVCQAVFNMVVELP
jgi:hypothetical protein